MFEVGRLSFRPGEGPACLGVHRQRRGQDPGRLLPRGHDGAAGASDGITGRGGPVIRPADGRIRALRRMLAAASVVAALTLSGCRTVSAPHAAGNAGITDVPPPQKDAASCRALSKADLDHVIDARLSRQETVRFLQHIELGDYGIADPYTNWMHSEIRGAASKYSIYYFSYRQRFFILLLVDGGDQCANCLDAVILPRSSPDYELGMGPVEVDNDHYDDAVVVVFNKNWNGDHSDDIIAAYKPNLKTLRLEVFPYRSIRIYRED
jgi:hypothetical protein